MANDDYQYNAGDDAVAGDDRWAQFSQKDDRTCRVYDGDDFFTAMVQIFLAVFALGSLYLKRMKEVPRRTLKTWALDVGKQGIGACYAHVCNMVRRFCYVVVFALYNSPSFYCCNFNTIILTQPTQPITIQTSTYLQAIAAILSQQLDGETQLEDECAWYGLSYLIDTTLGLVLAIMCLRIQDHLAEKYNWESLLNTGVYHGEHACKHWTAQTISWVVILTVVKIMIYYFMLIFKDVLAFFGSIMFAPLQINIRFELLFVMIFFPGFLNVIYFWIADSYLKASDDNCHAFEESKTADKEMALISEEEKKAHAQADGDMAAMSERQQHQQHMMAEHTDWGKHTEFIAAYLPSWSVFGVQAKPDDEDVEPSSKPAAGATMA